MVCQGGGGVRKKRPISLKTSTDWDKLTYNTSACPKSLNSQVQGARTYPSHPWHLWLDNHSSQALLVTLWLWVRTRGSPQRKFLDFALLSDSRLLPKWQNLKLSRVQAKTWWALFSKITQISHWWSKRKIIINYRRSWVKYRDLSVASRSVEARNRTARRWEITIFWDNRVQ